MLDHFSFHNALAYTYPHWLYDSFIYLVYKIGGYTSIYISTILLFYILITIVYKTNLTLCKNLFTATFATFICELAIASFITARAQLVSFILFVLVIYFIEMFLKKKKKKYLFGLLLVSLILCNIHVAVWPFYFILYQKKTVQNSALRCIFYDFQKKVQCGLMFPAVCTAVYVHFLGYLICLFK